MTWERYSSASDETGIEGEIWSGRVFYPRYHCDNEAMGVQYKTKPPTCLLQLTPRVQFLGEIIEWNISESGSATGTIASFDIDWGGSTDIGDFTGELWATDPLSGDVLYDAVGVYTVEAFVTDLLGTESQHCISTVEIILPEERAYVGTTDLGVFVMIDGATPVASNTGLSGDQLKLRALRVHPVYADLPGNQQHVWIATKDGVSYSTDGGATWTNIDKTALGDPQNTAGDSPVPASADLDQIDISFDSQDDRRVYLLRTTTSPKRVWVYKSEDYGQSFSNSQVGI